MRLHGVVINYIDKFSFHEFKVKWAGWISPQENKEACVTVIEFSAL
jgi:hypothetical protein